MLLRFLVSVCPGGGVGVVLIKQHIVSHMRLSLMEGTFFECVQHGIDRTSENGVISDVDLVDVIKFITH